MIVMLCFLLLFYRAEDAVDKLISVTPELKSKIRSPSRTLLTHFVGYEGDYYST